MNPDLIQEKLDRLQRATQQKLERVGSKPKAEAPWQRGELTYDGFSDADSYRLFGDITDSRFKSGTGSVDAYETGFDKYMQQDPVAASRKLQEQLRAASETGSYNPTTEDLTRRGSNALAALREVLFQHYPEDQREGQSAPVEYRDLGVDSFGRPLREFRDPVSGKTFNEVLNTPEYNARYLHQDNAPHRWAERDAQVLAGTAPVVSDEELLRGEGRLQNTFERVKSSLRNVAGRFAAAPFGAAEYLADLAQPEEGSYLEAFRDTASEYTDSIQEWGKHWTNRANRVLDENYQNEVLKPGFDRAKTAWNDGNYGKGMIEYLRTIKDYVSNDPLQALELFAESAPDMAATMVAPYLAFVGYSVEKIDTAVEEFRERYDREPTVEELLKSGGYGTASGAMATLSDRLIGNAVKNVLTAPIKGTGALSGLSRGATAGAAEVGLEGVFEASEEALAIAASKTSQDRFNYSDEEQQAIFDAGVLASASSSPVAVAGTAKGVVGGHLAKKESERVSGAIDEYRQAVEASQKPSEATTGPTPSATIPETAIEAPTPSEEVKAPTFTELVSTETNTEEEKVGIQEAATALQGNITPENVEAVRAQLDTTTWFSNLSPEQKDAAVASLQAPVEAVEATPVETPTPEAVEGSIAPVGAPTYTSPTEGFRSIQSSIKSILGREDKKPTPEDVAFITGQVEGTIQSILDNPTGNIKSIASGLIKTLEMTGIKLDPLKTKLLADLSKGQSSTLGKVGKAITAKIKETGEALQDKTLTPENIASNPIKAVDSLISKGYSFKTLEESDIAKAQLMSVHSAIEAKMNALSENSTEFKALRDKGTEITEILMPAFRKAKERVNKPEEKVDALLKTDISQGRTEEFNKTLGSVISALGSSGLSVEKATALKDKVGGKEAEILDNYIKMKSMEEISSEVRYGNKKDGFRGLNEYMDVMSLALEVKDESTYKRYMRDLLSFKSTMTEKANRLKTVQEALLNQGQLPSYAESTKNDKGYDVTRVSFPTSRKDGLETSYFDINKTMSGLDNTIQNIERDVTAIGYVEGFFNSITSKEEQPPAKRKGLIIPESNQHYVNKYRDKDREKFKEANKLIASPLSETGSSTKAYLDTNKDITNTGKYEASDIVAVSINGRRAGIDNTEILKSTIEEMNKAIEAGAIIITDNVSDRSRDYNKAGEGLIGQYLQNKGYTEENGNGVWKKDPEGYDSTALVNTTVASKNRSTTPVFSEKDQTIDALRKLGPDRKFISKQFGNPFGVSGQNVSALIPNAGTVTEVSEAYFNWIKDGTLPNVKISEDVKSQLEEQRTWIRGVIGTGRLKGKSILYMPTNRDTLIENHAYKLAELINSPKHEEWRKNLAKKEPTETPKATDTSVEPLDASEADIAEANRIIALEPEERQKAYTEATEAVREVVDALDKGREVVTLIPEEEIRLPVSAGPLKVKKTSSILTAVKGIMGKPVEFIKTLVRQNKGKHGDIDQDSYAAFNKVHEAFRQYYSNKGIKRLTVKDSETGDSMKPTPAPEFKSNLEYAITTAIIEWITTADNSKLTFRENANKVLGRDPDSTLPEGLIYLLGPHGIPIGTVTQALGKLIAKHAGITRAKDENGNVIDVHSLEMFEMVYGGIALNALLKRDFIKITSIDNSDIQVILNEEDLSNYNTLNTAARTRLISIKDNEELKKIKDDKKLMKFVEAMLGDRDGFLRSVLTEPVEKAPHFIAGSTEQLTKKAKAAIQKLNSIPFQRVPSTVDFLRGVRDNFGIEKVYELFGYKDLNTVLAARRESVEGNNLSITKEVDALFEYLDNYPDEPMFFDWEVTVVNRMQIKAHNLLNPQSSKIHRFAVSHVLPVDLEANSKEFYQFILSSFDMDLDKHLNDYKEIAAEFLESEHLNKLIDAYLEYKSNPAVMPELLMKELSHHGTKAMHVLNALDALSQRPTDGTYRGVRPIVEADDKTSGPILAILQLFGHKAYNVLETGGINLNGSTHIDNIRDLYVRLGEEWAGILNNHRRDNSDSIRYLAEQRLLGVPNRKTAKLILMPYVYGRTVYNSVKGYGVSALEKVLEELETQIITRDSNTSSKQEKDAAIARMNEINSSLFILSNQSDLFIPMTRMDIKLDRQVKKDIERSISKINKEPLESAIESTIGRYIDEGRDTFTEASEALGHAYITIFNEIKTRENITSEEGLIELSNRLDKILPVLERPFSKDVKEMYELVEMKNQLSMDRGYQLQPADLIDTTQTDLYRNSKSVTQKSITVRPSIPTLSTRGKAAFVGSIHTQDGSSMQQILESAEFLNIYDAHISSVMDAAEVAQKKNKSLVDIHKDFNVMAAMSRSMDRFIANVMKFASESDYNMEIVSNIDISEIISTNLKVKQLAKRIEKNKEILFGNDFTVIHNVYPDGHYEHKGDITGSMSIEDLTQMSIESVAASLNVNTLALKAISRMSSYEGHYTFKEIMNKFKEFNPVDYLISEGIDLKGNDKRLVDNLRKLKLTGENTLVRLERLLMNSKSKTNEDSDTLYKRALNDLAMYILHMRASDTKLKEYLDQQGSFDLEMLETARKKQRTSSKLDYNTINEALSLIEKYYALEKVPGYDKVKKKKADRSKFTEEQENQIMDWSRERISRKELTDRANAAYGKSKSMSSYTRLINAKKREAKRKLEALDPQAINREKC